MSYLTQFAQAANLYADLPNDSTMIGFYVVVGIIAYVIYSWLMGHVFQKAGVPAWKAWVPVYNNWTLLELGKQPGWWAIVTIIPYVGIIGIIFLFTAMYNIGLGFGKKGIFVLWAIFLPLVWYTWLAFDNSKWHGEATASADTAPTAPTSDQV